MLCFYNMRPVEGARGPAHFHVTAGKNRGNKGGLTWIQGCKRRVSHIDPSCSAGIYLSMDREDSKYQHSSQCPPFLSLQRLLETHWRGSAALRRLQGHFSGLYLLPLIFSNVTSPEMR